MKTYKHSSRGFVIAICVFILLMLPVMAAPSIIFFSDMPLAASFILFVGVPLGFASIYWFSRAYLSTLTVYDDRVVWKSLFCRAITLKFSECNFVGIADMKALLPIYAKLVYKGEYSEDFYYVYLSSKPFPSGYEHKASYVKCNNEIIVFVCRKALLENLIDVLPTEKKGQLISFNNRIEEERRQKDRKKRKKK